MTGPEIIEEILADPDDERRCLRVLELDAVLRPGGVCTWQPGYDPMNLLAGASVDLLSRLHSAIGWAHGVSNHPCGERPPGCDCVSCRPDLWAADTPRGRAVARASRSCSAGSFANGRP